MIPCTLAAILAFILAFIVLSIVNAPYVVLLSLAIAILVFIGTYYRYHSHGRRPPV